jgi:amino acid adenylation domain-containing protein/non-ribosomal peptide synthase protein (TIGR01720 family)
LQKKIRDRFEDLLPDYLAPTDLVAVSKLPLNVNGKVDRKFLVDASDELEFSNLKFVAPKSSTEILLAEIWQSLLEVKPLGIEDDFFESGGHSLLAVRVVSAIKKKLNIEIDLKSFFANATIAKLSAFLERQETKLLLPPIVVQPRTEAIPLSFAQERLWFIDKLQGSSQYHIAWTIRVIGKPEIVSIESSFKEIVRRHEVLRTVISEKDGVGYQLIKPAEDWEMTSICYADLISRDIDIEGYIAEEVQRPYDLSKDMMLRVHLVETGNEEYVLLAMVHHIAFDGWSMSVLSKELTALYNGYCQKKPVTLPHLPVQYADYSIWQRSYLEGNILEKKVLYWKEKLQNVSPLDLPLDYIRPTHQSIRGGKISRKIGSSQRAALLELSHQEGCTLFMTLLASFKILLYRYTGQQDICVGSPIAGRQQQELESMIGFFVNTLAFRSHVDGEMSFVDLLKQVKVTCLEAYEHQEAPFEKVVDALGLEREMSRSAVFQVLFALQNIPEAEEVDLTGIKLIPKENDVVPPKFDLNINVSDLENSLSVNITYCRDLFKEDTIERFFTHYENLLEAIITDAGRPINTLSILDKKEEAQLLSIFNNTAVIEYKDKTLIDLFEEQARLTPEHTALVFQDEDLSYKELDTRSNQLGHYLRSNGVKKGTIVPICIDRSFEMIIGILGVLKAGGAYVPIDPDYPVDRITYMLNDAGGNISLSISKLSSLLRSTNVLTDIIELDKDWNIIKEESKKSVNSKANINDLMYIIYTSGSTGRPKGVLVEHGSLANFVLHQSKTYQIKSDDRVLQFYNYCFDPSVEQIFLPLINGACCVLISDSLRRDLQRFEVFLTEARITHLQATPSFLINLRANKYGGLRRIIAGGEICSVDLYTRWVGICDFYNKYGPTETAITAVQYKAPKSIIPDLNTLPIGKPVSNTHIYILDSDRKIVPIGVPGEIYIGGVQVARGYLNQPELTAEKFLLDPYSTKYSRMYRTGDIGRWLPDGNIEFLGRRDDQVKIRGYRIELGEVESVLQQCPEVLQAVVIATSDSVGNLRLVGYLVVTVDYKKAQVQEYLQERLPEYMIPSLLIEVKELVLTSTGKVDKKALPPIDGTGLLHKEYVAPRTELESQLVAIWKDLLEVEQIGIEDNFFELGGHSIATIQVVSRLRKLGYELHVSDIFSLQTVGSISAFLERQIAIAKEEQFGECALLPVQKWCFDTADNTVSQYNEAMLFSLAKSITKEQLSSVFSYLVVHHDSLRFSYSLKNEDQADRDWVQYSRDMVPIVESIDMSSSSGEVLTSTIRKYYNRYCQDQDIEKGELAQMVLFRTSLDEPENRLMIILHTLLVDGNSWNMLVEDIAALLESVRQDIPLFLGAKGPSYQRWSKFMQEYAQSKQVNSQQPYWEKVVSGYKSLKEKEVSSSGKSFLRSYYHSTLDNDITSLLIKEIHEVYHTNTQDILLVSLSQLLCEWGQTDSIVIGVESSGRGAFKEIWDLRRSIGLFTALYPIKLFGRSNIETGELIKEVKEELRKVPDDGLGYGALKYLRKEESVKNDCWDVRFTYRELNLEAHDNKYFTFKEELSLSNYLACEPLYIRSELYKGNLLIKWDYDSSIYDEITIANLATAYIKRLKGVIEYCKVQKSLGITEYTPADYGLTNEISYQQLDAFLKSDSDPDDSSEDIMVF